MQRWAEEEQEIKDGAGSQCSGGQRREQEIKDGAGIQCRGRHRRSRNSRTMQRISTEMGRGGAGTQDGAESQCRGGQRREQEIKDGAGSQCRDQQRRSRNSRTVQRVSAEVGRVGAGTQGRCRESVQRWAE
jgi:hypothetical protein